MASTVGGLKHGVAKIVTIVPVFSVLVYDSNPGPSPSPTPTPDYWP